MTVLTSATARRRAGAPAAVPVLTYTAEPTTLVSDGRYNSFPGVVTCPNGDVLVGYRAGDAHLDGGDLYTLRSTDGGATWGSPVLVAAAAGGLSYGTATLSIIDNDRIALVTWMLTVNRVPVGHSARIFISDDNGATWDAPLTVDLGASWLGTFSVSESPLVYRGGWYYLGAWGRNADTEISSGVVRSSDLSTWTRVAHFGGNLYNEIGVAAIGDRLVCVIRTETAGRWVSTSIDGATWTDAVQVWAGFGGGAPKLAQDPMLDVNVFPVRPANSGGVQMACVDSTGAYHHLGTFTTTTTYMYGQTCKITPTTGGLVYAVGGYSGGVCTLYWRPFSVAPA